MKKNIIIMMLLSVSLANLTGQNLRKTYRNVIEEGLERSSTSDSNAIVEEDLAHLPALLQHYLKLTGVIGQQRVHNVRIKFKGRMRGNPDEPWMEFTSEQYNFFDQPTRAFYIKAKKMGLPVNGLHLYKDTEAYMKIKLAGLFKIIDVSGAEMNQSETVTFLNDICFFAPAALVDMPDIEWEEIDEHRLRAVYTHGPHTISAILLFNEDGMISNFISDDRFEIVGKESNQRPWFTPVEEYGVYGGKTLPKKAGAWYKRPEGDFCYGEFTTVEVSYNVGSF